MFDVQKELEEMGMDSDYIKKVLTTLPAVKHISETPISGQLQRTKVTLFKALLPYVRSAEASGKMEVDLSSNDNDIAQYTLQPMTIINMPDHHRWNILEGIDTLKAAILPPRSPQL